MSVFIAVILFTVAFNVTGCKWGDNIGSMPDETNLWNTSRTIYLPPANLSATDGTYKEEIGLNWDTVENAVSYRIFRSDSVDGTYTQIAQIQADAEQGSTGTSSSTGTTVVASQAEFISDVDLTDGKFILGGQTCRIRIQLGNAVDAVAEFPGKTWGHTFTWQEIVDIINSAAGKAVCYASDGANGEKFIKIISTDGAIVLENANRPISYVPLAYLLKNGLDQNQYVRVDPTYTSPGSSGLTYTAEFVSDVDLTGGIDVKRGEDCKIRLQLGASVDTVIEFAGPAWWAIWLSSYTYSLQNIIDAVNKAAGIEVCYAVDGDNGKNYIKIKSELGAIVLENESYSSTYPSPVAYFFKQGTGRYEIVYVEPTVTGQSDDTGSDVRNCYDDTSIVRGAHYYYKVRAVYENGNESDFSEYDEGFAALDSALDAPKNISATDGEYSDRVIVTWSAVTNADYYRLYRVKKTLIKSGSAYSFQDIETQVGGNITATSYEDTDVPPGKCLYSVAAFSNQYGEGAHSGYIAGYRTMSDQEFLDEFNQQIHYAFYKIPHLGNFGDDTVNDDTGSGSVHYVSSWMSFMSKVKVEITFTNYCDSYMIFNGEQLTVITNILSQSGTLTNQINVTGIYTGYVRYNIEILSSNPGGGNYVVSQDEGVTETSLSWENWNKY